MPDITIIGNLIADPKLTYPNTGKTYVKFTVAENQSKRTPNGEFVNDDPAFYNCTGFDQLAENVTESLHKGDAVVITGRLKQRRYTRDDGSTGTAHEVVVQTVGASLKYASVEIHKNTPKNDWNTAPVPQPRNMPKNDPAGNLASLTGAPADPWTAPADNNPPF